MSQRPASGVGILAGTGIQDLAGLTGARPVEVDTPFGRPSGPIQVGEIDGRTVAFLARHGDGHRLLPSEVNYRANIYALKLLGVERILSASAVGSMRDEIHPQDVVVPDQFVDRTRHRQDTFFGDGLVAHVGFADPVCGVLREVLVRAAGEEEVRCHDGGSYLCMEGPQFSTRAESLLYRGWGVSVIGMTNLTEAKLAREAEICYATLALVTDYDCWHEEEAAVSVDGVVENLRRNAEAAARILRRALRELPGERGCGCGEALRNAILTRPEAVPEATRRRLAALVHRYLPARPS